MCVQIDLNLDSCKHFILNSEYQIKDYIIAYYIICSFINGSEMSMDDNYV